MLRKENLFRGLILDTDIDGNLTGETTKEWVFGNLIQQYDYLNGCDNDPTLMDTFIRWDGVKEWGGDDEFPVDPKSVGQKTGRKDIKGADIYEGDILFYQNIFNPSNNKHFIAVWSDEDSAWMAKAPDEYCFFSTLEPNRCCKIVGTIFDTPEEGGNNA
jgi:hypothetical protein